ASARPAGSVSLSLEPRTRLPPDLRPWQQPALLRSRRPDSRKPSSKPLPPTAELLEHCRKRLPAERQSLFRWLHFPCCPCGWRNPLPAWSVPAPFRDDRHTPRCQMRAPVQSSLRTCPQTTLVVPPSRRNPAREKQERKEHYAIRNYP